jgi:hypothetical protein
MNKNRLWILIMLILLITPHTIAGFSYEDEATESSINEMLYPTNPRYYYDATILLISRVYKITEIDGFHDTHLGKGYDNKITLYGEHFWPVHIFIIWVDSEIVHRRKGGINTKLELFDYEGWMFGQDKTTILNMTPLKIYGHCDEIKITVYRS